jgi:predicted lipase
METYSQPNSQIIRDPYYLTDDIDNYIVKEDATDDVVVVIKRSKLRDWEAFKVANDATNYLNLSEEKKYTPEFIRDLEKAHETIKQVLNDYIKKWKGTEKKKD